MFSRRTDWPQQLNRYTKALHAARHAGRELLDLTASNPTIAGFEYGAAGIRDAFDHPDALRYLPEAQGLATARQAIARYYAELPSPVQVDASSLFVVSGTSEAYSDLFRLLCEAGDEVLIAAPGYPLLDMLADICDVRLIKYHLFYDHGWHIDMHDLEQRVTARTRAIVLVHPNNPTGSFVKPSEREQLDCIAKERNLALIVDEVFLDFPVEGNEQRSFAGNEGALTFTLSGISKICGLPQMKAAWMYVSGPEESQSDALRRLELIADTFLSASTPIQLALPRLLATRADFQNQLLHRIRKNLAELDRQLGTMHACARLQVEGGWYVTLRVPSNQADEELAISLIEKDGVIVESGHFFDFPQDGYLVLSLMTPEREFAEGVHRLLARF